MDRSSSQMVIHVLKVLLTFKDDIGGIFRLHYAPVVTQVKLTDNRTKLLGKHVEFLVDDIHLELITYFLSIFKGFDIYKHIVDQGKIDVLLIQSCGQPVMAVKIDLEPERTPSRHSDIAEAKVIVDEIKIIMQALTIGVFQVSLMCFFVMPWLVGGTRLHC